MTGVPAPGATPYKLAAGLYLALGWSPIPLPYGEKWPPPNRRAEGGPDAYEYTGGGGNYVTDEDVAAWCSPKGRVRSGNLVYPPGNIAIRLPPNVLGIDVDAHDGRAGAATLSRAEAAWGKLPPTWVSSSRPGSPKSGIRLFRIPTGLSWPGGLGMFASASGGDDKQSGASEGGKRDNGTGGVELIRFDHRYAIVSPSIHSGSRLPYFWRAPDGTVVNLAELSDGDEIDLPGVPSGEWGDSGATDSPEISDLPEKWVQGLTGGATATSRPSLGPAGELSQSAVRDWLRARVGGEAGGLCRAMERTLTEYSRKVRAAGDDGGAHDVARDGAWALIGDAAEGHSGVSIALNKLRNVFLGAVAERRGRGGPDGERIAKGEWARAVVRGVSKVAAEGEPATADPCAAKGRSASGRGKGGVGAGERGGEGERHDNGTGGGAGLRAAGGRGSERAAADPFYADRSEGGLAERLRAWTGGDVRWCKPLGGWFVYDDQSGRWNLDAESIRMTRSAMDLVAEMKEQANKIDDEKQLAAYLRHVSKSDSKGQTAAALELLKSLDGISVASDVFDAEPRLLGCLNGVLELKANGVEFRPARRQDYLTGNTGIRYVPDAQSEDWDKFLDRFLPDAGLRSWAQKLAGYTMLGENPARVFILAKGETSTGKTTFVEAIRSALGSYGGTFLLGLLRDKQDEGPRPDIVAALRRRLIVAEETSGAWVLHADQIKRATSGGTWSARGMNAREYVERVPAFTPWIATNDSPTILGADAALRRRLRVIPFLEQISTAEEQVGYGERLSRPGPDTVAAREAIFAWMVQGWRLYLEDESLTDAPPQAIEGTLQVLEELSEMDACLAEICDRQMGAEFTELAVSIYSAYLAWMEVNGTAKDIVSANKFGRILSSKGFVRVVQKDSDTGKAKRGWRGLKLSGEWAKLVLER